MLFQKVKRIYTRLIFLSAMFIIDQSRNTSQLKYCAELSQLLSLLQLQVCDLLYRLELQSSMPKLGLRGAIAHW